MNRKSWINRLRAAGVADPAGDIRRLYDWAYGIGEGAPEPQSREAPNEMTLEMFEIGLEERESRKPVSHILGTRAFWRGNFEVTHDVLDPRPETELLVELALGEPFDRVLDLGTGSGCIIISLLMDRPKSRGVGTDISPAAALVAGENARSHGLDDRLILPLSDWYQDVGGRFDLIVSNPPYIAAAEMESLAPEVRLYEPRNALTDGADGLSACRKIAEGAPEHLKADGRLLVEIGYTQAKAVVQIFRDAGLDYIEVHTDLNGRDRVVSARQKR